MQSKIQRVYSVFRKKKIIIAFSGGVDSSVIAILAKKSADKVICCTLYHPLLLDDLEEIKKVASEINVDWRIIEIESIPNKIIEKNPKNRCYICKTNMMKYLIEYKNRKNFDMVVDGTNYDDLNKFRPGIKALKELGVVSPLVAAKLTKREIRDIAKSYNLSVAQKSPTTCLLSRIPYNEKITKEKIEMIKKAENFLKKDLNMSLIRVRTHNLAKNNFLARIEAKKEDIRRIIRSNELTTLIISKLKEIGYNLITIDLEGYHENYVK
ncbi:MAG: ATP-dependent sacrificial sulfur transferase LarE [Candidatus Lokiarchaeota archaeon]|nr:ATP-dependent sacrificial sulfur transferase LarE [Candidatus Lokiarchaeota archaeon]